jgi:hypothetical protein
VGVVSGAVGALGKEGRARSWAALPAGEGETVGEEQADRWAPVVGLAGGLHPSVEEKKSAG